VEAEWKPNGSDIADDLLRYSAEQDDIGLIARVFGIDRVGADMERITGLSPATLSRTKTSGSRPHAWRHIATVAAIAREVLTLMEGATGRRDVDPAASRRWLYGGKVNLHNQALRPIDALSDESLSVDLLADLRHSNAR
jgi:hypothetical protein